MCPLRHPASPYICLLGRLHTAIQPYKLIQLFKTKSLYTRLFPLFPSSWIPKHLKWSWRAVFIYTRWSSECFMGKTKENPNPTHIIHNQQGYFCENHHSTAAFHSTKTLHKEAAGFVLIWQFYGHRGEPNCPFVSDNLVSVKWLMY